MTADGDEWLSGPQAAKLLGIQLHTLHALINRGEPAVEIAPPRKRNTGRRSDFRIHREAIDDFLERARVKPGELRHPAPALVLGARRLGRGTRGRGLEVRRQRVVVHPAGFGPMLPSASRDLPGVGWAFEPKLDGWSAVVHAQAGGVTAYSRPGRNVSDSVPN